MAQNKEVNERSFKGIWIPKEVYLNQQLTWTEKILLIEIDSLDGDNHCFASNAYFAKFLSCHQQYVSDCVGKLKALELIRVEQVNNRRIIHSNLKALYGEPPAEQKEKPTREKAKHPTILQVVEYFVLNGYPEALGQKAFNFYNIASWTDSRGNKVINWKQKMQSVWFKEENKVALQATTGDGKILDLKLFK